MSRPDLAELGGWPAVLGPLADGRHLTADQTHAALADILAGQATDAQIAGLIVALRLKGETIDEVTGLIDAMLDASQAIVLDGAAIDIVGTGGSPTRRVHALNVSTMACLVAAGAGATVCKHGNLKASSTSGSFDLLGELGVKIELGPAEVARCVRDVGIGFAFARAFHPAMRFAGPVRGQLGIPTVFNILGPLSHPAGVTRQVLGVGDVRVIDLVSGVLAARGAERALVVHGSDGLDEITLTGPTTIHQVTDGAVTVWEFDPADLGLEVVPAERLRGGDPATNAALCRQVLAGEPGPVRDIVVLNAAAGLWVASMTDSIGDGLVLAAAAVDDGRAAAVLDRVVQASNAEP